MKIKDGLKLYGTVRLYDADTGELLKEAPNMVVADGRNLNGQLLINAAGYTTGITYCAIGTSSTAVGDTQHQLVAETARQQNTQKTISGDIITISTFFVAANCTVHIRETALFGHSTATITANSGVMFSRALLDYDNSSSAKNLMIAWSVQLSHA